MSTSSAIQAITPELRRWIIEQAQAGHAAPVVLQSMRDAGWDEDVAAEGPGSSRAGDDGHRRHQFCRRRSVRSKMTMAGSRSGNRNSEMAAPRPSAPPRIPVL